jgi:hypothetical protein
METSFSFDKRSIQPSAYRQRTGTVKQSPALVPHYKGMRRLYRQSWFRRSHNILAPFLQGIFHEETCLFQLAQDHF